MRRSLVLSAQPAAAWCSYYGCGYDDYDNSAAIGGAMLGLALGTMIGAPLHKQQIQAPVCYSHNGNPYYAGEDGGVRIMDRIIIAVFLLSLLNGSAHAECMIMDDGQQTYAVCWNGLAMIRTPVWSNYNAAAPRTPMSGPGMSNVGMSNMGGVSAFNY
jgi:hypothetical protein